MKNWSLKITEAFRLTKRLQFYRGVNLLKHLIGNPKTPLYFSFEPTTACNLSCPECPSGLGRFTRPEGNTTDSTFEKLLDEWGKQALICTFYFQGEPFIHPHIYDYITRAKDAGLYTISSSNGHFFNRTTLPRLIDSGLDKLIVSLDGITSKTYTEYRVDGDFDQVMDALHLLNEAVGNKRLTTQVIVQFIAFSHNEHEVELLPAFMEQFPHLYLELKTAQVYGEDQTSLDRIPKNRKLSRYAEKAPERGCGRMEKGTVVTWDGAVLPCCFDKDAEHAFGNGLQQGFSAAWNNSSARSFRKSVKQSRSNKAICANCSEGRKVWL